MSWTDRISKFVRNHKKGVVITFIILALFLFSKYRQNQKINKLIEEDQNQPSTEASTNTETTGNESTLQDNNGGSQEESTETTPKGFKRKNNGTLLSIGDPEMTSEDVIYTYLRALSLLDFSTASQFSRNSMVLKTYKNYFDSDNASGYDYRDAFLRKLYKEALLSLEVTGIENTSVFAEDKQAFTVKIKVLDFANKDFWLDDATKIYNDLDKIEDEGDSSKSERYIYDYVLDKYSKSKDTLVAELLVDLTVERFPEDGSGWLVTIDKDLDDIFKYREGKQFTTYIRETYREYTRDKNKKSR